MKRAWPWCAALAVSGCASASSAIIAEGLRANDASKRLLDCTADVSVVVRFIINRDGAVHAVYPPDDLDRQAARCIDETVRRWRFGELPEQKRIWLRAHSRHRKALVPRARVYLAPVSIEGPGTLPWTVAYQRVIDRTAPLIDCYRRSLVAKGELVGTVVVRLAIGPDGRVKSVHSAETLAAARLVTCAKSAFVAVRFPEPVGGPATVTIPIDFFLAPAQPAPNP